MTKKKYNPQLKTFLGVEVRTVTTEDNKTYIVLKDMFNALGRLRDDGQIQTPDRDKMALFLEGLDISCAGKTFTITYEPNKTKSRKTIEVECLELEVVPIVLTQFKPTARKGDEALKTWFDFMKFVKELLIDAKAWEYIFTDKELNKQAAERITDSNGSVMRMHQFVNRNMAILCGVYPEIKSLNVDECRTVEPVNKIDVMEAREYVIDKFCDIYELTKSHKEARDGSLKLAAKKYNIEV